MSADVPVKRGRGRPRKKQSPTYQLDGGWDPTTDDSLAFWEGRVRLLDSAVSEAMDAGNWRDLAGLETKLHKARAQLEQVRSAADGAHETMTEDELLEQILAALPELTPEQRGRIRSGIDELDRPTTPKRAKEKR